MKVGELQKLLDMHDEDTEIILSSDGEGNSYSPLSSLDFVVYEPDSTWSGEVKNEEDLIEYLIEDGVVAEDFEFESVKHFLEALLDYYSYNEGLEPRLALILWPTN